MNIHLDAYISFNFAGAIAYPLLAIIIARKINHELCKPGIVVASELQGSNVTADAVASKEIIISFNWKLIIM